MEKPEQYADIAARLKKARNLLGKSQVEFGKDIGVSKQTYNHYESGKVCIPPVRARRLLEIYGISLDFIYAGSVDTFAARMAIAELSKPSQIHESTSKVKADD